MNNQQLLARTILQHAQDFPWTLQGIGKLQLYLTNDISLHVWHKDFRYPGVSLIHSHPWDFSSEVLWGRMGNHKYGESPVSDPKEYTHCWAIIDLDKRKTEPEIYLTRLINLKDKAITAGDRYSQCRTTIHETSFVDGTVTLCRRNRISAGRTARVFWKKDTMWGSAAPRQATREEVALMTKAALQLLAKEVCNEYPTL